MSITIKEPIPADSTILSVPDEPESIKPGPETSEFWIALASVIIPNLITVLSIFKVVPMEVASTLSTSLLAVVSGIITIWVTIRYLKSRTAIKVRYLELQDVAKVRKFDVENARLNFMLQLHGKDIISKDEIKKEFKVA